MRTSGSSRHYHPPLESRGTSHSDIFCYTPPNQPTKKLPNRKLHSLFDNNAISSHSCRCDETSWTAVHGRGHPDGTTEVDTQTLSITSDTCYWIKILSAFTHVKYFHQLCQTGCVKCDEQSKSVKRYEENHHDDYQHTEMTESSIKSNKITSITKFGYIISQIFVKDHRSLGWQRSVVEYFWILWYL